MSAGLDRVREAGARVSVEPDGPLRQGAYKSPLRDERIAAILGATLGVLFTICFITGLYSHALQHPPSWLSLPPRPAGLYRITQGLHVAAGIASMPVLLAKLWVVWPRFVSWPPFRGLAHGVERLGLLPLVAGGIFVTFSGVANIAQWYPWPFSFIATHYWMSWVTMGAMVAHVGAKWAIARRTLTRPSRRPRLADADPVLGTTAETESFGGTDAVFDDDSSDDDSSGDDSSDDDSSDDADPPADAESSDEAGPDERKLVGAGGLSRRGFLGTTAAASAVLTVTTVGQTITPLRHLALLAPRDPSVGPQGRPVNRGAVNAGVVDLTRSGDYRLVVEGRVRERLTFDVRGLEALPAHSAELPIACVEGWSFSAAWAGVRVRDLLEMAGADLDRTVRVESLEPRGAYRISILSPSQAADRDTLLATHLDGERLVLDHGYPCRLIAPNRPGVLQTKWVTRIEVV